MQFGYVGNVVTHIFVCFCEFNVVPIEEHLEGMLYLPVFVVAELSPAVGCILSTE